MLNGGGERECFHGQYFIEKYLTWKFDSILNEMKWKILITSMRSKHGL